MLTLETLSCHNHFSALPEEFYRYQQPLPLTEPQLVSASSAAALLIGLESSFLQSSGFTAFACGNQVPSWAKPLATAYAGHQFGHFVPALGDGRALLLGEVQTASGEHWELQLKGSGPTPFSRGGDGRAVLRSSIREYLCSEAMHALNIPTTRALSVVKSPQPVYRERVEPAAVVVRLAPSFVRFGHFEWWAARAQHVQLRRLADYVIDHDFPMCRHSDLPYQALLEEVIARTATLVASWQAVGFCHGVLNTDNMSILGLTLDYGPFAFLEAFNWEHICNASDQSGRYAYAQQPSVAFWNLRVLAVTLSPLLQQEAALAALRRFQAQYEAAYYQRFAQKLGLEPFQLGDCKLVEETLALLDAQRVDFPSFWRALASVEAEQQRTPNTLAALFKEPNALHGWLSSYRARLHTVDPCRRQLLMAQVNPVFVLRNYLIERAIRLAEDEDDPTEVNTLLRLAQQPFNVEAVDKAYIGPAPATVPNLPISCSS